MEKQVRTQKRRSPMNSKIWTYQNWPISNKTYIHQFCVDTGCLQENLPRVMRDRDGYANESILSVRLDDDDDDVDP